MHYVSLALVMFSRLTYITFAFCDEHENNYSYVRAKTHIKINDISKKMSELKSIVKQFS